MASLVKTQSSGIGGLCRLPERASDPLQFSFFISALSYSICKESHRFPIAACSHRFGFERLREKRTSPVKLANAANRLIVAVIGDRTAAEPQLAGTEAPFIVESGSSPCGVGAVEVSISEANDYVLPAGSRGVRERKSKANLPPRICTLRAFGKSGEGVAVPEPDDAAMSTFCKSLADNVEFSAEIRDWEILSGRLAMIVFASAVLLEALTGNNVFEKPDSQRLLEFCAALVVSILGSAGFALAWQAKTRVTYTMSKGYESLINGLIDNVIDGLLFDEET